MIKSDNRSALNILRGFASIVVVFYHFRYFSDLNWFEKVPWVRLGFMGVDFFFILSGLIISHVYLKAMEDRRETYLHFLYLRFARIFPVHFLIMIVMLAAALLSNTNLGTMADWFSLTFLFRQLLLPDGYAWNTPAWSVSAEMFAYAVVFPLIIHFIRGKSAKRTGIFLVSLGAATLTFLYSANGTLNATNGIGPLLRVTGGFAIGAGLFRLLEGWAPKKSWDNLIIIGLMLLMLAVGFALQHAIIAAICVIIVGAYMSNGPISSKMSGRYGNLFGEISFALYMCHVPLLMLLSEIALQLQLERGFAFCMASLACCIVMSWVLYKYVEVPSRTYLKGLWVSHGKTPFITLSVRNKIGL